MLFRLCVLSLIVPAAMLLSGCDQIKENRATAYYEQARALYETQHYREALIEVQHALEFNPDFFDALVLQGRCYYDMKNFKEAALSFEKASLVDGTRGALMLKIADAWMRAEKFSRAIALSNKVLKDNPDDMDTLYINIRARVRSRWLNSWASVDTLVQPLLKDKQYRERAFALLAEFHVLNDDLDEAESILQAHEDPNDDWLFAMRVLAQRCEARGDQHAAVRIYRSLVGLFPDNVQDTESLFSCLRRFGFKDQEREFLKGLMNADPRNVGYELKLIDFYIHYGQYAKAEELIRAGLQGDTGYFDFARYLIELYDKTKRYDEGIQFAKDVLKREGDNVGREIEFMNSLAEFYYMTGDYDLAKFVVRWVLGLDRDNRNARFLLARISIDEGRTLLAIAELRALCAEDMENPDYDYYLGLAHMARKEIGTAEQSFHDALSKQPLYKAAFLELADIYIERGLLLDAEQMVSEFLTLRPDDPDVLALREELAGIMAVTEDEG